MISSSSRILAELNTNHGGDFDWIGIVLQAIEVDTIKIAAPYGDQFRCGWKKCKEDYKVLKLAVKGWVKPLLRVKKIGQSVKHLVGGLEINWQNFENAQNLRDTLLFV